MKQINKVAVLGSGLMGTGIACHLAGNGFQVLLLDIVPFDLSDDDRKIPAKRNSLAAKALKTALKAKPAALYSPAFAQYIEVGNFEDDMPKIKDCDWIIEVVVERLDIKQQVYEQVEKYRTPGTIVSSNTSGIPIHMMNVGRSEDFQKHFLGTHFFNPPRYLRLLEIIPTPKTDPALVDYMMSFGDKFLGKQTVRCKDTPAFIANRVGVYTMAKIFHLTEEYGLTIEEVDRLTGPAIGRPKTGTYRLADLVGLDTALHVINGIQENCPKDEQKDAFDIPKSVNFLVENKFYGNKSGKGYYYKSKERDENGKAIIYGLDLNTLEYRPSPKVRLDILNTTKQIEELPRRIKAIFGSNDKGAQFIQKSLLGLFAYVSNRIPEISDDIFSIDDAMRAGFAWEIGPFQYWDIIGIEKGIELAEAQGEKIASWVREMIADGRTSFYKIENNQPKYYDVHTNAYRTIPGQDQVINLNYFREQSPVFKNAEVSVHDIGDGVLCLEFQSKMNAIGEGILRGLQDTVTLAEDGKWKGLVIGNNATNFSVGANLMLVAMMAYQQEFEELNMAIKLFQDTAMRMRYSDIPVVSATQGYVFGGGCEISMHCDGIVAAAESYIGLVEVGVGLLPGGGGTKEFALRASDSFFEGDVMIPTLIKQFKTIATAAVATSAYEAYDLGYMLKERDIVEVNVANNIAHAKEEVLERAEKYQRPQPRKDIYVLGREGLGALYVAANELKLAGYATDHDITIAKKIAYVLCGGDLTGPQKVSEQYLLNIEREAFLSLCGEQKTLERIQHMLTTNKPLRN